MIRALLFAGLAGMLSACTPAPSPAPATRASQASHATAAAPASTGNADGPAVAGSERWDLPGELGPRTTRAELEARFGKANVREETFDGAEGIGTYPALVVFPDDPRKRLELVFDADDPAAPIRELRVPSVDSLWHETSGLRTGMRLAELVALNGAPVSFYGLGWDYGGTVADWHGGKLANADGNPLFHRVILSAREGTDDDAVPSGDATFRSDDARWPAIGKDLIVVELGISWPSDGDE